MISLDYQSGIPIYEQIANQIERLVSFNVLKPGQQIMSIRELATSLGINPNTVKKAYDELEKRGTINTFSTKGTFITENIEKTINRSIKEKTDNIKVAVKELMKLGVSKEEIINKIFWNEIIIINVTNTLNNYYNIVTNIAEVECS